MADGKKTELKIETDYTVAYLKNINAGTNTKAIVEFA